MQFADVNCACLKIVNYINFLVNPLGREISRSMTIYDAIKLIIDCHFLVLFIVLYPSFKSQRRILVRCRRCGIVIFPLFNVIFTNTFSQMCLAIQKIARLNFLRIFYSIKIIT